MISAEKLTRRRSTGWTSGLLHAADLGLLVVAVSVTSQFGPEPMTAAIIALSGLVSWMALSAPKYQMKRLSSRRLAAPMLATVLTLVILAGLREPYSGTQLAAFTAIWTIGLLAVRLSLPRFWPPLKVLLLSSTATFDELLTRPDVEIAKRARPPRVPKSWDVIAFDAQADLSAEDIRWLNQAAAAGYTIISAHQLFEELIGKLPVEVLEHGWVASTLTRDRAYTYLKRFFDVASVILLLPVLVPLCALVALVVLIDGGRPVLFWQDRMGQGGKAFRMVKFRTMRQDAEVAGAAFATNSDSRITRVGKLLRKFRLDELPQFWNVLRGEMSIIGPRPEQVAFARDFDKELPLYGLRHAVLPGITGWAQVTQGYAANADETLEKLRRDLYYIKHLSFFTDIRILLRTVITVFTGFGSR